MTAQSFDGAGDTAMTGDRHDYFNAMYGESDDPYALRTRWYELRKRNLLLAALPRAHYRSAYEPGCGVGELTAALALRCDSLLASDFNEHALAAARARIDRLPNVRLQQHDLPRDWPDVQGPFDLIVLSEVGYFLDADAMLAVARKCRSSLELDGTLVACDWRPDFDARVLPTETVHAMLSDLGLSRIVRHEEDDFLLQVWSRDARSVAEQEGIR